MEYVAINYNQMVWLHKNTEDNFSHLPCNSIAEAGGLLYLMNNGVEIGDLMSGRDMLDNLINYSYCYIIHSDVYKKFNLDKIK